MATVKDLKICAKGLGLKGYSSMTKNELEEFITKSAIPGKPQPSFEQVKVSEVKVNKEEQVVKDTSQEQAQPCQESKHQRGKSSWNQFLSDYRSTNNCSLKVAMGAKDAYAEFKAKSKSP